MVMMMAAFAIAAPHALVLTVSHGSLLANPLVCNGNSAAISLTLNSLTLNYVNWARSLRTALTMRYARRTDGVSPPLTSCAQTTAAFDCGVANL
jgi:hypothetical protein